VRKPTQALDEQGEPAGGTIERMVEDAKPSRETTVLFADVSGSTKLYETLGDAAAHEAIARCLGKLREAAELSGGRVVKNIGDEVMVLFPQPDAAAMAAARMQAAMEELPAVGETRLGLRVGFNAGPVIQRDNDVFGDTVNLASRLAGQARKDQILTSAETAAQLGPLFRSWIRQLYAIQVKGKSEEVVLVEIVWKVDQHTTKVAVSAPPLRSGRSVLRLKYLGRETVRRRESESITLGRDEDCGLKVPDERASRHHCTVERRSDRWVLKDHSTNGTWVTAEGEAEIVLRREEFTLGKHGWIAFGQTRTDAAEVVEYFCEESLET
jgi:adenylate cyclase